MPNRPKKNKNMSEETQELQAPEVNIGDFSAILQIIAEVTEETSE